MSKIETYCICFEIKLQIHKHIIIIFKKSLFRCKESNIFIAKFYKCIEIKKVPNGVR